MFFWLSQGEWKCFIQFCKHNNTIFKHIHLPSIFQNINLFMKTLIHLHSFNFFFFFFNLHTDISGENVDSNVTWHVLPVVSARNEKHVTATFESADCALILITRCFRSLHVMRRRDIYLEERNQKEVKPPPPWRKEKQ